jgi:hypothetical protein
MSDRTCIKITGSDRIMNWKEAAQVFLFSAVASAGVAWVAHYAWSTAPVVINPTGTVTTLDPTSRYAKRLAEATWPELDQREVNELAAILQGIPETDRSFVTIFCADEAKCGDLQLDFDNAFETAHWTTRFERPLIDTTTGISTSSKEIGAAIAEATHGRIVPRLIDKNTLYIALVIGAKPKAGEAKIIERHIEAAPPAPEVEVAQAEPEPAPAVPEPATPIDTSREPTKAVVVQHKRAHGHHRRQRVTYSPCGCVIDLGEALKDEAAARR